MKQRILVSILLAGLLAAGCKKKEAKQLPGAEGGAYFSIRQFAADQFRTFRGQPFTLERIVIEDGKTDSSLVSVFALDWNEVLTPFFEADISAPEFQDQYTFSTIDDATTGSRTYYYEAKNKELFTRSLQLVTDPFTDKIKSVFIETADNGRFGQKTRKLYYKPIKLIQIQEFESSLVGKDRNLRIEYRFLY